MLNRSVSSSRAGRPNQGAGRRRGVLARIKGALLIAFAPLFAAHEAESQTISPANLSFAENVGLATITIENPGPGNLVINYSTMDGTAKQPADYQREEGSTGFALVPGRRLVLNIRIFDDNLGEDDEYFTLRVNGVDHRVTIEASDTPFTLSPKSFPEDAGTAEITITNTDSSHRAVSTLTQDGTAKAPGDYTAQPLALRGVVASGASVTANVEIKTDDIHEPEEHFFLDVNGTDFRIYITDTTPPPTVDLSLTRGAVEEGDGNRIVARATLSAASGRQTTVDYRTVDGSARSPGDYAAKSGTLTFAAGETTKDIEVTVADDADKELPETFDIELTSATNATLGTNKSVTATITQPSAETIPSDCATMVARVDDVLSASGPAATVTEADFKEGGEGVFTFIARNEGPLASRCAGTPVRLDYEIGAASDDATFGTDYIVKVNGTEVSSETGSLLFTSSNRSHVINVVSVAESPPVRELLETMTLTLKDPERLNISHTLGYKPDLMALRYVVRIQDASPAPDLEIRGAVGGHSVDENGGLTYHFPVQLKADPWIVEDVTVECDTADGTATAGEDYAALTRHVLTFEPTDTNGTSHTKSCPIAITDDALDEAAETLTLEISAPTGGATIAGGATTDSDTLTIREDPSDPAPVATLSATPVTVSEARGAYQIDVSLDTPTGRDSLLVGYRLSGTATIGQTLAQDYYVSIAEMQVATAGQFEIGRASKIGRIVNGAHTIIGPGAHFTIVINNDTENEPSETIVLELLQATSMHATIGSSATQTVTIQDNDATGVTLTPSSVDESVGAATFAASLDGFASGDVTVEWETQDGAGDAGAVAGQDYASRSGTLTITSSDPNPTISIPIVDDSLDEAAETFDIELSSSDGTALPSTHAVTINDDDGPPSASLSPTEVDETDGTVTFAARLASSGRAAMVEYATRDGTAKSAEDYARTSGTLTFAKGDTEESFTVAIEDDVLDENDETFEIVLTSPNGTARASTHAVTIAGDDDDPPSVSIDLSSAGEDAGRVTFAAKLSEGSGRIVTVDYATSDGTARAGTDYSSATGTLTFAAADVEETFEVELTDNALEDGDRTFQIALSSPDGTILAPTTHTVAIVDDESPPRVRLNPSSVDEGDGAVTFTARLDGRATSGETTVEWETGNGTAEAGKDYAAASGTLTFTAATPNPTLEVAVTDDALNEDGETFRIEMTSADGSARASSHEVTIADDDPLPELGLAVDRTGVDEGGRVVATATLTPASGRGASVGVVVEDGTTDGDYAVTGLTGGRLTFVKGDATETFHLDIVDDPLNELAETFTVRLTNPEGATLGTQVSSVVTIAPDASDPEPSVAFERAEAEVLESEGRLDVEARLSAESGRRVTVDYATADATGGNAAVAGEDYRAASGTLTFEPGQMERSFPLEVEEDGLAEDAEILDIVLSGTVGATMGATPGMRVTILDRVDPILAPIASYLSSRVESLLAQQPSLAGVLRGESPSDSTPGFSLSASDDGARAEAGFAGGRVWGSATGVWSSRDGAERLHLLGTVGAHAELTDYLMLGGMLQFDSVAGDLSGAAGEIRGRGWMAGPYFVASGASGRLRFEGRLLRGRSSNEIEGFSIGPGGTPRDGSFEGERWLALAGVEGEYRLKNGAVALPSADLGHVREVAEGFRDGFGREVEGQRAALTRLRLGATFEIPVDAARGDLTLRPGLRFVATDEDGGPYGESGFGAAGRIDFGVDYRLGGSVALEFDGFYSGIGRRDRESYGAGVGLRMDF